MSAWGGLLKKELRLGLIGFLVPFFLGVSTVGLAGYMAHKYSEPAILVAAAIAAIIGHLFYLPLYVAVSISGEQGKMHLWLHNPLSGYALLSAKYMSGLITMALSLLIPALTFYWNRDHFSSLAVSSDQWTLFLLVTLFFVVAASFYLTLWGVLLWAISRLLVPYLGKLRWLAMIVLVMVGLWLFSYWESTAFYRAVTEWGAIDLDFVRFMFNFAEDGFTMEMREIGSFYIGSVVYDLVVASAVFLLSGWLLDRKIEV